MIQDVILTVFMISMLIFSVVMLIVVSFGLTFVFGAPWVPTRKRDIKAMLSLAGVQPGDTVTDLGSGDGRLLILAVKQFKAEKAIGHEIHPGLIVWARLKAMIAGVSQQISFKQGNIHKLPIEQTDVVVLYLLGSQMNKLASKLKAELDPETKIISNGFKFSGVIPEKSIDDGERHLHLYRAGDLVGPQ